MRAKFRFAVALAAVLAGCELAEVAAPGGEDLLVVEAVLRVGALQQSVLLHRSLEGRAVRGEPGASVTVTSAAGSVEYRERPLHECRTMPLTDLRDVELRATCYRSPLSAAFFVKPEETYQLSVSTSRGEQLRGQTRVPGLFELRSPSVTVDALTLDTTCTLPTQPFQLVWTRSEGAWAYISSLRLLNWGADLREQGIDAPDPLELVGVSVSAADTSLAFPMNLGLFQRFDLDQRLLLALQAGIPAVDATLVVLAGDRNFINSIRGGRFNPSGNIRGSSVVGDGVGVFASVVPLLIRSPAPGATAGEDPPLCPGTVPAR